MWHLGTHLRLVPRLIGHGCGVLGVMFGLDAIATTIDPSYLGFFPFHAAGIQQDSAAVLGLAMIAAATWLVWASEFRRRRSLAALSRRAAPRQDGFDKDADR